jgi:integrase
MPPRRKGPNKDLPPRLHYSDGAYYYVPTTKPRKWRWLSKDLAEALLLWAKLEGEKIPDAGTTFEAAWLRYKRDILPKKAPRTQTDNIKEAKYLLAAFGSMQLDAITPKGVEDYMEARTAKIRATREKALMSHIFNKARSWGMTNLANPCAGIAGTKSERDRYVDDREFQAVWTHACRPLRDAMDLALLIGQRPGDVLRLSHTDVRDGALWLKQRKTGKKLRVLVVGELAELLERCKARASTYPVASLRIILDEHGQPLNQWTMRAMFDRARKAAGVDFQFRDIRAKAATDLDDLAHAQTLLGHKRRDMTESYVRSRAGEKVRPLR